MLERSSDSLIKITIGKSPKKSLRELKLDNLLHILEVVVREENDQNQTSKQLLFTIINIKLYLQSI